MIVDRAISADTEHSAEIRTVDGVSRLFVDGQPAVPIVYKGKHAFSDGTPAETFAGKAVQENGVKLMVKEIRLGWTPGYRGFWTKDGFDLKGFVKEIKDAMRIADKSLFIIAVGCTAYPEFTIDEHPEETWRRADGSVVEGTAGSCTAYKAMGFDKEIKTEGVDFSVKGFSEKFIMPGGSMADDDESYTFLLGKVISYRDVIWRLGTIELSFIITWLDTALGAIPAAMSRKVFDLSALREGVIIAMNSDIKADFYDPKVYKSLN